LENWLEFSYNLKLKKRILYSHNPIENGVNLLLWIFACIGIIYLKL